MDFLISGSDFDSESWSRFVMSFNICTQNMVSFRVDLIGNGRAGVFLEVFEFLS